MGLLSVAPCAPAEGKSHLKNPVINVAAPSHQPVTGVGAVATATAVCPAGTRLVGGGWLAGDSIVFESRKVGVNAWRVSAQNRTGQIDNVVTDSLRVGANRWRTQALSGKVGAAVTGYAYCAKQNKAPPAVARLSDGRRRGASYRERHCLLWLRTSVRSFSPLSQDGPGLHSKRDRRVPLSP